MTTPEEELASPEDKTLASEQRSAPRVAAGLKGRIRIAGSDEENISVTCGVVDISQTGCQAVLPRQNLPGGFSFESDTKCSVTLVLDKKHDLTVHSRVAWSQRTREDFFILGIQFIEADVNIEKELGRFIIARLRMGLGLQDALQQTEDVPSLIPLEVPLEAEASHGDLPDYRFMVQSVGADRLEASYAPRQGETKQIPEEGAVLDILLHPPVWARGEKRSLRFATNVLTADGNSVQLSFHADGSDLAQMIRALIPPRVEYQAKPMEVDYQFVILIIAAVGIALLIAYLGSSSNTL